MRALAPVTLMPALGLRQAQSERVFIYIPVDEARVIELAAQSLIKLVQLQRFKPSWQPRLHRLDARGNGKPYYFPARNFVNCDCASCHNSMPTLAAMEALTRVSLSRMRAASAAGSSLICMPLPFRSPGLWRLLRGCLYARTHGSRWRRLAGFFVRFCSSRPTTFADQHDPRAVDVVGNGEVLLHFKKLARQNGVQRVFLAVYRLGFQRAEQL